MPRRQTIMTTTIMNVPVERAAGLRVPGSREVYYFKEAKTETITIGRGTHCDIQVLQDRVSELHAVVNVQKDGHGLLRDSSLNGTFVDGRRLEEDDHCSLLAGMQIQLGSRALVIATDAKGRILIEATTIGEYCYLARELYGNETIAADFIGRSRKFIKKQADLWRQSP